MKRPAFYTITLLATLHFITITACTVAARDRKPFETIDVRIGYCVNTNRNLFHEYWHAANGVDLSFRTPFHVGEAIAGVAFFPVSSRFGDIPDFKNLFPFAGWGMSIRGNVRICFSASVVIGSNLFFFDDEPAPGLRQESVFGVSASLGLDCTIGGDWSVGFAGKRHLILTHERIRLTYIVFGLNRRFDSPSWLEGFLQ